MKLVGDIPIVLLLAKRLSTSCYFREIIFAISDLESDDSLADFLLENQLNYIRGSSSDVLDRFYRAALRTGSKSIARITADCPLVDIAILDRCYALLQSGNYRYVSNCHPSTYPDGMDVEVMTLDILREAHEHASTPADREHVTPWIRRSHPQECFVLKAPQSLSHIRVTVDEPEDLVVVNGVYQALSNSLNPITVDSVCDLYRERPSLFEANSHIVSNEGSRLPVGQKLWRRAQRVIPGGNMLLSKRPEMFLPELWPAYFSKARGCRIWDLDGRELIDMSIMGIGTNLLGYGHPDVDAAVVATVSAGNMSTLNCPEEVLLAEKLVSLHPWAEMVRFARSGGEANAIAIRIARAATGRDTVAICGYHGWHDWYLATNLENYSGLEEHLLPGLEPNGVPKALSGSVLPFSFNRLDQLESIAANNDLAAVKMEVQRSSPPHPGFLEGVRKLCTSRGIVLIFDECTSGFRETFGGLHLKYGVQPDMAMFGKALGNGYAITATIGRRAVMDAAQTSFISSTFWTERIGPTAALKTLEVMERERSWQRVTATGLELRRRWQDLADCHDLRISHNGLPALTGFTIESSQALAYKTLITQEMLKRGYLAGTSCYTCLAHTRDVIEPYLEALDGVFSLIAECEGGRSVEELLEGPVCHGGFRRLN